MIFYILNFPRINKLNLLGTASSVRGKIYSSLFGLGIKILNGGSFS